MVTQERLRQLFDYNPDAGSFRRKITTGPRSQKGAIVGSYHYGYLTVRIDGKDYKLHRLAWLYVHGAFPPNGFELDHKNRNRSDNRIGNLRLATRSQNLANAVRGPSKGLFWNKSFNRWVAKINKDGKQFYLGCFKNKADARKAYAAAAKEFYGEFARICCIIFLLGMASCAPTLSSVNPEGAKRIAQAAFKPITWSKKDTAPTVRQIKAHNEVGVQLGLWKYPPSKKQSLFRRLKPSS